QQKGGDRNKALSEPNCVIPNPVTDLPGGSNIARDKYYNQMPSTIRGVYCDLPRMQSYLLSICRYAATRAQRRTRLRSSPRIRRASLAMGRSCKHITGNGGPF